MKHLTSFLSIIVAIVLLGTSCKKDDEPVVPVSGTITLKVSKPEQVTIKDGMSFKAHFILDRKVVKSLDVKIGDNKIEIPRANYSNIIVTSHDFFDFSRPSTDIKYPELLTLPPVNEFLPRHTTRFILHGENQADLTSKNEAVVQLQSFYKLIMIRKNDVVAKTPYILYYGKEEFFKEVRDENGENWYAFYVYGKAPQTQFIIGVKTATGRIITYPVTEDVNVSTVKQFTFILQGGYTTETFSYDKYDHVNVMETTMDLVLY